MRSLAFGFQQGRIRVVSLQAVENQAAPSLIDSSSIVIDHKLPLPELMDRYRRDFQGAISSAKPDVVATRFNYESDSLASAHNGCMPAGIVALVCHGLEIAFKEVTIGSLRSPGPFGLPVKTKPVDQVDQIYGAHPPHWDKMQKETLLAAWRALL